MSAPLSSKVLQPQGQESIFKVLSTCHLNMQSHQHIQIDLATGPDAIIV